MIETVTEALKAIDEGKIIAVQTDTVFGFIADGNNEDAVNRLYELKNRDKGKGYIIFVENIEAMKKYAKNIPSYAYKLMDAFWPGALTFVCPARKNILSAPYLPDGQSIGLRMPNVPAILALLQKTDKTIISTSANISGETPLYSNVQIKKVFGDKVTIWDLASDVYQDAVASTVIDCQGKETWMMLREGSISKEAIWSILDADIEV